MSNRYQNMNYEKKGEEMEAVRRSVFTKENLVQPELFSDRVHELPAFTQGQMIYVHDSEEWMLNGYQGVIEKVNMIERWYIIRLETGRVCTFAEHEIMKVKY